MASLRPLSWLRQRFPGLRNLGRKPRRKRIPFLAQMHETQCPAACLAMVLAYHGKELTVGAVDDVVGSSRDGANFLGIKEAAEWFGLRCRGLRIEVDDLKGLPPASILHWDGKHFVVFERVTEKGVHILDPAYGRRCIPLSEVGKHFTGPVLLFEPGVNFEAARGGRPRVRSYLKQVIKGSGVLDKVLVTSILVQVFALALPLLTQALVDQVVPHKDWHLLRVLAVGLGAAVVFTFLASIIRAHLLLQMRTQLDVQMTLNFVEHLMNLPYAFFQKRSTGDLMMRLNSNATVREVITSGVLAGFLDGTLVIAYFGLLLWISPRMCAIVLLLAVAQVGLYVFFRRRYRELMAEELERQASAQGYEVQMLAGIETLKSAGSEQRASEHWTNLFVDALNITLARGRLSAWVESALAALRMLSPLVILCVGAGLVIDERMSLGTMLAINALAAGLLNPLASVVGIGFQFSTVKSYIERIDDVLEAAPEQDTQAVSRAHALEGRVALDRVSFRYGPLAPMVLKDVSVDIKPGRRVAIVGYSGSGKSTLARLLAGLYAPTEGRILYDGADLNGLEYRSVRKQLGLVPQEPYLFGGSIRSNIALAVPELPLADVERAARLAHIHKDIVAMPMRYETPLTDRGASLSGGQRQRVALARALVQDPRILVLDEATSDLDAYNERCVQRKLRLLKCTTITIAHRLSTIVHADLILVMRQVEREGVMEGRVVERGTHEQLLALNGEYARLFRAQMPPGHEWRANSPGRSAG